MTLKQFFEERFSWRDIGINSAALFLAVNVYTQAQDGNYFFSGIALILYIVFAFLIR